MLNISLVLHSLFRDWKSGELTLLTIALVVAVTVVTALNQFTYIVNYQLDRQTGQLLGADVLYTSKTLIPASWQKKAADLGLKQSHTVSFLSMISYGEQLELAEIKAISAPYPLHGHLEIAPVLFGNARTLKEPPEEGKVWLGTRLFSALGVQVGDTITIGAANFIVDGAIVDEPGQTGDWFNIAPRIIMNHKDVEQTATVQKGSNLTYGWLLAGSDLHLQQLKTALKNSLNEQRWTDRKKNSPIVKTIERTLKYLQIGTILSLILAGVATSMATLRYSRRHQQHIAVLRCFGASRRDIFTLYLGSITCLGVLAALLGIFIGYALQPIIRHWLGGLLVNFEAPFSFKPALLSFASGLIVLLSFSWVNIINLSAVSPVSIFRRQTISPGRSTRLGFGLASLMLIILAYWYTRSAETTIVVIMGCLFFILFAVLLLVVSFTFMAYIKHKIPIKWHWGFANIERNLANSSLQIVGIGLALTVILTLSLLKNNLLNDWQQQLPPKAPNFFIINIEPAQVDALGLFLDRNNIQRSSFYPMVKGRVVKINQKPLLHDAYNRDLNFSWTDTPPPGNEISEGLWAKALHDENWASVELGFAQKMGLKMGDTFDIRVGEQIIHAEVSSLRKVNWTNFKPNFFILFRPGLLNHLPQTFIASIYLADNEQNKLLPLIKLYPNVTIIDVANIIKKVQLIFTNAGKAITLITFFGLSTGLIITILAILSLSDLKQQETYILKVLGMRRSALLWVKSSESCIIGFYAGLLAITSAIFIDYTLNVSLLGFNFKMPWFYLLLTPLLTALGTMMMNNIILLRQYKRRR